MADPVVPLSPEWWLARLFKKLVARREAIQFYSDYYEGNHPLPWLAPQARDEFRRILLMTRSNYMGLVVDAMVERMHIEGFRLEVDSDTGDVETWRIWQANNLDSDFDQAILESAICGVSYGLVAPNQADASTPHMWVEHPSQAIVEFDPSSNRRKRAACLKVWDDDWTGQIHATMQVAADNLLYKFQAPRPTGGVTSTNVQWVERDVKGEQPNGQRRNPLAVVSMVEIPNKPRLLSGGVSELADLTDIQDRVNKTIADRLMTQDYGAFPLRWSSAWPDEDADGNQTPPIDIGRNRMLTTSIAETKFGQFDSAPLDPYSTAKREDVKDIASRSRTPAQYLLGEMSNVNGETLKASESGLVSKVRQRMRTVGEPAEEFVRLARRAAGLPEAGTGPMETIWQNPQYRTEGELVDSVVKKLQSGLTSRRQGREDIGYSATQIARLEAEDVAESTADPILSAARALTQPPPAVPGVPAGQ